MTKTHATEEIIKQLRRGHHREANFKLLFDRYHGQLHRFFHRKGMSPEDCRDLTQEVFVSVYKGLKGLRDESQFQSWLFRIARNVHQNALEYRRAKKRNAREVSLEEYSPGDERRGTTQPVNESTPLEALLANERRVQLSEALQELPKQMRRCVQLRVVSGLSNAEIAAVMGISINTVKAHLHQAKSLLKKKLGQLFSEISI